LFKKIGIKDSEEFQRLVTRKREMGGSENRGWSRSHKRAAFCKRQKQLWL